MKNSPPLQLRAHSAVSLWRRLKLRLLLLSTKTGETVHRIQLESRLSIFGLTTDEHTKCWLVCLGVLRVLASIIEYHGLSRNELMTLADNTCALTGVAVDGAYHRTYQVSSSSQTKLVLPTPFTYTPESSRLILKNYLSA